MKFTVDSSFDCLHSMQHFVFFLMRSYCNNTCKAKTIVTDNYTSRLVEKKKKASKKHGIKEYFATLWSDGTENQKLRGGGGGNCCQEGIRGIKGIQVKVKKKTKNLYVTSEGIFISQGFTTERKIKLIIQNKTTWRATPAWWRVTDAKCGKTTERLAF